MRPDHCPLPHFHGKRADRARILCDAGIEQESEAHHYRRLGIGKGRINKAIDLWVRLGKIDFYIAAADRHGCPDGDIFVAAPVIIQRNVE